MTLTPTAPRGAAPSSRRRLSGFLAACIGVALSVAAFLVSLDAESRRIQTEFQLLTERNAAKIRNGIERYCDIQKLLRLYFEHSERVTRAEFRDLSTNLLDGTWAVQAIQWVPVVTQSERTAFERQNAAEGLAGFEIRNRAEDGSFHRAPEAETYWPISYCEPMAGNEAVMGYNLQTGPNVEILRQAAASGESLGTQAFSLAQLDRTLGWILMSPVFGAASGDPAGPRKLLGFVQVVFRLENMLEAVIGQNLENATRWTVYDVTGDASGRLLFRQFRENSDTNLALDLLTRSNRLTQDHIFTFRGRNWKLTANPAPDWLERQRTLFPFVILGLGLCLTVALQLYVFSLTRRTEIVEREVAEKTAKLSESNRLVLAESAARKKVQDHLELVLRGADLGTWQANVATGALTFSDRMATMLGFDPPEPEHTRDWWRSRIHPDDLPASIQAVDEHLAGRTAQIELVQRIRKKDGSYLWVIDLSSVVERDAEGHPQLIAGTRADINDRTLAEIRALRLATAVEQATESIVLLDMQGRLEFANRSFAARMGQSETELLGREFDSVWPEENGHSGQPFSAIAAEVAREGVWRGTLSGLPRSGQLCAEELIVSTVKDPRGQPLGHVVVARDITRETALEEQVRQSQKMEAVGLLAGGVAHDFNNLLQIIRGYAALAAEADSVAEERSHLGLVLDAVDRASQLTRQLLAFGRRQALQRTTLDLNAMTADMLRMIRRLIPENIEIVPALGSEPLVIRGDRGQIEQVLLNLCVNARDAMPEGGRLVIQLDTRHIDRESAARHESVKAGHYARLRVVDNGAGMDPATLARIFEPFFSTKPKDRGTGLGLSVVYGIIRQHDGFVDVISQPDLGTAFNVHFPLAGDEVVEPQPEPEPAALPKGDGTVLLVEDEPPVSALAVRVLNRAGYRVLTAGDGAEACEVFARHADTIDIVVMDMVMPRMGGREAFHRIRALQPHVPILFCTGYSSENPDGTFDLPAGTSLLAKPYLPSEFSALIGRMIRDAKSRTSPS